MNIEVSHEAVMEIVKDTINWHTDKYVANILRDQLAEDLREQVVQRITPAVEEFLNREGFPAILEEEIRKAISVAVRRGLRT